MYVVYGFLPEINVFVFPDPGPPEEDEVYEECQEEMTRVYLVQQEELVSVPEYSGVPLRHAMLNTKQVHPRHTQKHALRHLQQLKTWITFVFCNNSILVIAYINICAISKM